MTERERLIKLIDQSPAHFCDGCKEVPEERAESIEKLADYLLTSIVRCKYCKYAETVTCPITGTKSLFLRIQHKAYCCRYDRLLLTRRKEQAMKRYIDADALLNKLPDDLPYKASVKRVLMQAPTADVVEIVRCKDCKDYEPHGNGKAGLCKNKKCQGIRYENDFCRYGKRRESDG